MSRESGGWCGGGVALGKAESSVCGCKIRPVRQEFSQLKKGGGNEVDQNILGRITNLSCRERA